MHNASLLSDDCALCSYAPLSRVAGGQAAQGGVAAPPFPAPHSASCCWLAETSCARLTYNTEMSKGRQSGPFLPIELMVKCHLTFSSLLIVHLTPRYTFSSDSFMPSQLPHAVDLEYFPALSSTFFDGGCTNLGLKLGHLAHWAWRDWDWLDAGGGQLLSCFHGVDDQDQRNVLGASGAIGAWAWTWDPGPLPQLFPAASILCGPLRCF